MRVVSRKELMELIKDKDMLFADINRSGLEGLYVASCFGEHDFVRTCLISMIDIDEPHLTYEYLQNNKEFELDLEYGGRDGLYDNKAQYAIYETEDINRLISRLAELNS